MKKIIISILLIASLPLIGATDDPKKQLPWTEKGKILRKVFYKYLPISIFGTALQSSIIHPTSNIADIQPSTFSIQRGIKWGIRDGIFLAIIYPIYPYIGPILTKPSKYITAFLSVTSGVSTTLFLYNNQKKDAAVSTATTVYYASMAYVFHKGLKEIQEKTDALNTHNQPEA